MKSISILLPTILFFLHTLIPTTTAQAQDAANCPPPFDIKCFINSAQYTILGTVLSNTLNSTDGLSTASNYTATIQVGCVYYVSSSNSKGGLTASQIQVTGWGRPNARCLTPGLGADATIGETKIMFVYTTKATTVGTTPIYSVFDVCQGGFPNSTQYLQEIANAQATKPDNAVRLGSLCQVPNAVSSPIPSPTGKSDTGLPSVSKAHSLGAGVLGTGVALIFGLLFL